VTFYHKILIILCNFSKLPRYKSGIRYSHAVLCEVFVQLLFSNSTYVIIIKFLY